MSDVRVHLPIVGASAEVVLPVPGGKGNMTVVLPAARKLSQTMMATAVKAGEKAGRKVSCKAGCTACCYQLIPVSLAEAKSIVTALGKLPAAKQKAIKKRFEQLLARLEQEGMVSPKGDEPRVALVSKHGSDASERWSDVNGRYFELDLACPFLENDRCSIYDERPFVCREYLVTSDPKHCDELDARVVPVPRAAYLTYAVAAMIETLDGIRPAAIPLPLALEWMAARGDELLTQHDGKELLETFLREIEWNEETL